MEFSRRGPATAGAADSHRCPDPPPHGDAMLVMRDALLWQLHKDRLRQEIIVAELAKIERTMALHAASSNRTMSMPRDSMPQRREPMFGWEPEHYRDLGEEHGVKLPNNDGRQRAESRFWKSVVEDRTDECWNHSKCKYNVGQETTAFDVPKSQESDETVLSNKTSQAVKWKLTEITIAVKKPPIKWSCDVCQVQVSSEKALPQHCSGKKHRSNIATLESRIKAIGDQKVKTEAEPSFGTDHIKTSLIKWNCSTCQANGTCQSDLEEHLNGTRHQQNIAASCKGGRNKNVVTNILPQEAKLDEHNTPQHAEKPPSVWGCSNCKVMCSRESDMEIHLKGKKHLKKIRALLEETKNKAMNIESQKANLNLESVPRHADKTDCELDMESHLRDERHQLNVLALCRNINQEEKNPSEIAKDQTPSSGWDCAMCQAKCNSEAHFEHHCTSRKHQQKMKVIIGEGDVAKRDSLETADELLSVGSNSKNELPSDGTAHQQNIEPHEANLHESSVPQRAEKPPLLGCSICQVICGRESDLEIHLKGKRHIKKIRAQLEESDNDAMNSESQKANLTLDSMPQPVEKTSCGLDLESHLRDERLQIMYDPALHGKSNQDRNNPPEIAKDQIPSSEWDCVMCEAKCSSKAQLEHHCTGRKHQQKINVTLGQDDNAKVSSPRVEVPCKGDSNNDMMKNIESQEAKLHESNVPKRAEKPPLVGCSICQVICGRESDLEIHLKSKRHLKEIRALLVESKNNAMYSESQKANLNLDSVPQPAEITNCELDLERHLGDGRLQLMNDWVLVEIINQDKNNLPELSKYQIPSSEWDCAMCQAKCNSRAQFENHCLSGKHQRKTQVILGEGDIAKTGCLETVDELPSDGSNGKNELLSDGSSSENKSPSKNMEEQKALNFCKVCDLQCNSGRMLEHRRMGTIEQSSMQRNDMCSCLQVYYGC